MIEVEGFGFFGHITAWNVAGTRAAAAQAITDPTGRTVTGWDPDVSVYLGRSSELAGKPLDGLSGK
ncbi:hypothetical protein [Nonomuraea sp. NPDC003201]